MVDTIESIRSLNLNATEIREMTKWPDPMIEEFLSVLGNITTIATAVDTTSSDLTRETSRVTASPYEIKTTDQDVFLDTDGGDISANLRPGTQGRNYRLVNVGNSGNKVTVSPYGSELLFGANASEYLADQESILITYDTIEGWN